MRMPTLNIIALLTGLLAFGLTAPMAGAATLEEAKQAIENAQQLRAGEFAPEHLNDAREALADAEEMLRKGESAADVRRKLDEAEINAREAARISQAFSQRFHDLVEARDRMQMADSKKFRADLAKRAEDDFARVVDAFENGHERKAEGAAKMARNTIHAAEVVAAREQIAKPLSRAISGARKLDARRYAPKAMTEAVKSLHLVERIIRETPNEQTRAWSIARRGQIQARRATRIAAFGKKFSKDPAAIETWVDAQDNRMRMLGEVLGVELNRGQTPEEQLTLLQQAAQDMQQSHKAQMDDAEKAIRELSEKLSKYEAQYKNDLAEMGEIRRKLQLKRDAEAKIKRLTKLFKPSDVDILLTPDADVILRLKALNFRSGSAVIPPAAYPVLDHVLESIALFKGRNVRIEGHTDFIGSSAYNQELSERRAQAVREYIRSRLEQSDVDISAVGYGENKPIANNETAEGRARNRRIDIVLLAPRS